MSEIGKLIDKCLGLGLAPTLRDDGFRRAGRTFHRDADQCSQVVNLQASPGNTPGSGRFTLNLGIYFPEVDKLVRGSSLGRPPKEYECTIRDRIGHLLPGKTDKWWSITDGSDLENLSDEVRVAWSDYGKPWITKFSSLEEAYTLSVRTLGEVEVDKPIAMALVLGRRTEAQEVLHRALSNIRNPYYRRNVVAWAKSQRLSC